VPQRHKKRHVGGVIITSCVLKDVFDAVPEVLINLSFFLMMLPCETVVSDAEH